MPLRHDQGKVLVTGAAGFVGSHLIELLEQEDVPIVAWMRPGTTPQVTGARAQWREVEMHDRDRVHAALTEVAATEIYHLAGVAHVGDSWSHIHETFAGNVLATHYLFDSVRRLRLAPRVLITSSAAVYKPSSDAINESHPVNPNSPYGTSKLAQEMVARRAWEDDGIPALIARSFNHVGPRQSPAFVASSIARQIAEIEAGRRPPVMTMGNMESERDIMDVRDTVRAYRALMRSGAPGAPYNVCTGTAVRIRTLVDTCIARARVPIAIAQDPSRLRPNDTPLLLGDRRRIHDDTGWSPQIAFDQTVDALLDYWRNLGSGHEN